jgi:hypothetical protein
MELTIIVNDQIRYKENVESVSFITKDDSEVQILKNHTEAFFLLKQNSNISIKILESSILKNFLVDSSVLSVKKENNNNGDIITIICDKISEIDI